jgi:YidC/Oxa1 family membrane protein insertase
MEKRLVLALVLCFVVFLAYAQLFPQAKPPVQEPEEIAQGTTDEVASGTTDEPAAAATDEPVPPPADLAGLPEHPLVDDIEVTTENVLFVFTSRGGALKEAYLRKYERRPDQEFDPEDRATMYQILREDMTQENVGGRDDRRSHLTGALSILPGADDDGSMTASSLDTVSWEVVTPYTAATGRLEFGLKLPDGLEIRKTWTISDGEDHYDALLDVSVRNSGKTGALAGRKMRLSINGPVGLVSDSGDGSRVIQFPVQGLYGYGFDDIDDFDPGESQSWDSTEEEPIENAWAGLMNLFFVSVMIPDQKFPASGVSLRPTRSLENIEKLEAELAQALRERGRLPANGTRRLNSAELDVLGATRSSSCSGCSGPPPKTQTQLNIEKDLGRPLGAKEYENLGLISLASRVRVPFDVPAAATEAKVFSGMLFLGPKEKGILETERYAAFSDTRDTGWSWISEPLLWILRMFYSMVGNYGIAIIMLTLLVRGSLFPLSRHQQVSMQKYSRDMQKLKPKLDLLKAKHKDKPKKLNQEMMKLYKTEGVSMLPKGCLVMFVQIPIFIALFQGLRSAIELRHASFLWVADLTGPDHLLHMPWFESVPLMPVWLNILPILMTVTWWLSAKMAPKPVDPQQAQTAKMMQYMPIIFGVMLYKYQAGLALYMCISSVWSIIETKMVRRKLDKQDAEEEQLVPVIRK